VYEIKSSLILQPGPAALTDGLAELQRIVERLAVRAGETSSIGDRLR
jgi:iron complex transport system substrate-binding protein